MTKRAIIKLTKNDAYVLDEMIQFYREKDLDPMDNSTRSRLTKTQGELYDISKGRKKSIYIFMSDYHILNDVIRFYTKKGPGSEDKGYRNSWNRTSMKLYEARKRF